MTRPPIRPAVVAAVLVLLAGLAVAGLPEVATLVPADAGFVIVLRDAAGFKAQLDAGPLGGLWRDAALQRFLAPLRQQLEVESWDERLRHETGHDLAGLLELAAGGIAFYLPSFEEFVEVVDAGDESSANPFVVIAGAGAKAAELERVLLDQEAKEKRERDSADGDPRSLDVEREFREITMHVERHVDLEEPQDLESWARIGDVLAFAGTAERLEIVIGQVLDGLEGGAMMFGRPERATAAAALATSDAFVFVDLEQLVPAIRRALAEAAEDAEPAPVDPQAVLSALGFDALETAYCGLDLGGGAVTFDLGVTAAREAGLLKAFALGPGKAPQPAIVPLAATGISSSRFDFAAAWESVEAIVNAINPMVLAMAGQQLAAFEQQAEVTLDLRGDLLDNLGGEIVGIEVPDDGGDSAANDGAPAMRQDQVIALSIRDRTSLERLLTGLETALAAGSELFEERDFLGTTVYTMTNAAALPLAYAITDGYLLISISNVGHQSLEAVLIAASRPGESAWQRADVRRALAALPAGAQSIQFQDAEAVLRVLIGMCSTLSEIDDDGGGACDPAAAPDPAQLASHLGPLVSGWYKQGGDISLRMRVLPSGASAP